MGLKRSFSSMRTFYSVVLFSFVLLSLAFLYGYMTADTVFIKEIPKAKKLMKSNRYVGKPYRMSQISHNRMYDRHKPPRKTSLSDGERIKPEISKKKISNKYAMVGVGPLKKKTKRPIFRRVRPTAPAKLSSMSNKKTNNALVRSYKKPISKGVNGIKKPINKKTGMSQRFPARFRYDKTRNKTQSRIAPNDPRAVDDAIRDQKGLDSVNLKLRKPPKIFPPMLNFNNRKKSTGIARGKSPGIPRGKSLGIARGKTPGIPRGKPSGIPRGKSPGIPRGKSPGIPRGKSPGIPRGKPPGTPRGKSPGTPRGKPPGIPRGKSPGIPRGKSSGTPRARTNQFNGNLNKNQQKFLLKPSNAGKKKNTYVNNNNVNNNLNERQKFDPRPQKFYPNVNNNNNKNNKVNSQNKKINNNKNNNNNNINNQKYLPRSDYDDDDGVKRNKPKPGKLSGNSRKFFPKKISKVPSQKLRQTIKPKMGQKANPNQRWNRNPDSMDSNQGQNLRPVDQKPNTRQNRGPANQGSKTKQNRGPEDQDSKMRQNRGPVEQDPKMSEDLDLADENPMN